MRKARARRRWLRWARYDARAATIAGVLPVYHHGMARALMAVDARQAWRPTVGSWRPWAHPIAARFRASAGQEASS